MSRHRVGPSWNRAGLHFTKAPSGLEPPSTDRTRIVLCELLDRFLVAFTPTLVVVTFSLLFIPKPALALGIAGGLLAAVVAGLSKDRAGALVGGIAIGLPAALVAFIAFIAACRHGGEYCN